MDPAVQALLVAMQEANAQARRDHEAAMTQLLQGQNQFMERLGSTLTDRMARGHPERSNLVDPHGVGKPPVLTGKTAADAVGFREWRIKFRNWIVAAIPEASEVMERLETQNQTEITEEAFTDLDLHLPQAKRLSAQLSATLTALTQDEPFQVLIKGPKGP